MRENLRLEMWPCHCIPVVPHHFHLFLRVTAKIFPESNSNLVQFIENNLLHWVSE